MSNPIQTATGTSVTSSVTVSFTGSPSDGNTVAVALFFYASSAGFGETLTDNQGNSYTQLFSQSAASGSGNNYVQLYSCPALTTKGGSFSVTFSLTGTPQSNPFIGMALFELANVNGLDGTPAYISQASGSSITTPNLTPSASGDFSISFVTVSGSSSWTGSGSAILTNAGAGNSNISAGIYAGPLAGSAPTDFTVSGFTLTTANEQAALALLEGTPLVAVLVPRATLGAELIDEGRSRRSGPLPYVAPASGLPPKPRVFSEDYEEPGHVSRTRLPMMPPAPRPPMRPRVFSSDEIFDGLVHRTPLLAPPVPGPVPPPRVTAGEEIVEVGSSRRTPVLHVYIPPPVAGNVPRPRIVYGEEVIEEGRFYRTSQIPIEPARHLGVLILLRGGPATSANIPPPIAREPLYMTDTNQLFVGDGFNRHFIGGDMVPAPAHSSSAGIAGQTAWDGTYFYRCVATNAWIKFLPAGGFSASF